jgi:hypothetical protein
MILEFNASNWREFEVTKAEQRPKGPHFAAVLFTSHYKDDGYGSSYKEEMVKYFAFTKQSDLELWVKTAQASAAQFFFFEVTKLGTLEIKVQLGI